MASEGKEHLHLLMQLLDVALQRWNSRLGVREEILDEHLLVTVEEEVVLHIGHILKDIAPYERILHVEEVVAFATPHLAGHRKLHFLQGVQVNYLHLKRWKLRPSTVHDNRDCLS